MRICFLTSSRLPKDDRIFYHQAVALAKANNEVLILSSKEERLGEDEKILFDCFDDQGMGKKEKVFKMLEKLQKFSPELVICPEPISIIAASKYRTLSKKRVKLIYDITEWYPSKKNLAPYPWFTKVFHLFKFLALNIITAYRADAFIFGEYYKSIPYRKLFPKKRYVFSTYYPDLSLIHNRVPKLQENLLRLSYSGKLTEEKGFGNFLKVLQEINWQKPKLRILVKIIGWYPSTQEKQYFSKIIDRLSPNIQIEEYGVQSLGDYLSLVSDTDVFMDLRSADIENQHCLPIKLFYYAALQRPVLYSDLKAIRKEVDISKFGYLFKPNDYSKIASEIIHYLDNREHYYEHCQNARVLVETQYNWENIRAEFVHFVGAL